MHRTWRRDRHRLLLMLLLIVGVVTMHSTVAGHPAGSAPAHESAAHESAAHESAAHTPTGPAAPVDGLLAPAEDGSSPHDPMSAVHDLLHLCLAVLSGLLVLVALVLVAVLLERRRRPLAPGVQRPVSGPRAPPTTSARLARLCVLRN